MRTTLDIDDELLAVAKDMGARTKRTAGQVISELARQALTGDGRPAPVFRNGFELITEPGRVVTTELVQKLAEEADRHDCTP